MTESKLKEVMLRLDEFNGASPRIINNTDPICVGISALQFDGPVVVYDELQLAYIGLLDSRDLVFMLLHELSCIVLNDKGKPSLNLQHLTSSKTVGSITNLCGCNQFQALPLGTPFIQAIVLLKEGIRNVPVLDREGKLSKIIRQIDVIAELKPSLSLFSGSLRVQLAALNIGVKTIVSVKEIDSLEVALNKLSEHKLSDIPVVDEEGRLKWLLTGNDIVKIFQYTGNFYDLSQQTLSTLKIYDSLPGFGSHAYVTCTIQHTLSQLVEMIITSGASRAYILDDSGGPIGVISLRDLIQEIMFSPEHSVIHDNDQIIQKVLSQPLHAFPHHTSRQLIEVFADSRLDNASEILYRNYLSAMPVFDIQEKRYIGWLDNRDLCSFFSRVVQTSNDFEGSLWDLVKVEGSVTTLVRDVVNHSETSHMVALTPQTSLREVLNELSKGIHRVVVVRPNGKILRIVTQNDVTSVLVQNSHLFGVNMHQSVSYLGLINKKKKVVCIDARTSGIEALKILADARVSAIGITLSGVLVSSFSCTDVQEMLFSNISVSKLKQFSIADILAELYWGAQFHITDDTEELPITPGSLVTCKPWDTLEKVISKLAVGQVYRIFIVDRWNRPIGIISLKEIVSLFLKYIEQNTTATVRLSSNFQDDRNALYDTLQNHAIRQIEEMRPIVFSDLETTARDCFKLLVEQDLSSIPVHDKLHSTYVGWISTDDLVAYLVQNYNDSLSDQPLQIIESCGGISLLAKDILKNSRSDSFFPISTGSSMLMIASMMSRGLHRVPIIDISTNEIVRIVTRSDVTIFLFNNLTRLGNRVLDAVSTIRNSLTPVISIHQSAPLIEALRLMNDNNISAIPICDDHGKLADNFSCSDLRQILQESSSSSDFMSTAISVWMHCIRMRQNRTSFDKNEMEFSSEWEGYETKVCTLDMTISHLIQLFAESHVHRVYIVDDEERPIGVVTLGDLLNDLMHENASLLNPSR